MWPEISRRIEEEANWAFLCVERRPEREKAAACRFIKRTPTEDCADEAATHGAIADDKQRESPTNPR